MKTLRPHTILTDEHVSVSSSAHILRYTKGSPGSQIRVYPSQQMYLFNYA